MTECAWMSADNHAVGGADIFTWSRVALACAPFPARPDTCRAYRSGKAPFPCKQACKGTQGQARENARNELLRISPPARQSRAIRLQSEGCAL